MRKINKNSFGESLSSLNKLCTCLKAVGTENESILILYRYWGPFFVISYWQKRWFTGICELKLHCKDQIKCIIFWWMLLESQFWYQPIHRCI